MLMWRFWAGLPADGCRLGLRCLAAIVRAIGLAWGEFLVAGRWLAKAVWWLAMPSNLDHCEFPTGHFVARAAAFALLGVLLGASHVERLLMAMVPGENETVAMVFSILLVAVAAMFLAIFNLAAATILRGKTR